MRRITLLLTTAALGAAAPTGVHAQGNVRTTITPVAVAFPTPGVGDFSAGYIDGGPVEVDIQSRPSRVTWELQLRADAPDMGGYGKPVADILWRPEGSTSWQPLSTLDQVVASGSGDQLVRVHFRLRLDWAFDEPGSYSVPVTFTALRP